MCEFDRAFLTLDQNAIMGMSYAIDAISWLDEQVKSVRAYGVDG
jgi:hypothetical protein